MLSSNCLVVEQVTQWLAKGHTLWLSTVVETYGSSPRPQGSLMAFAPGQGLVGSLSGGCIEEDLLRKLASLPVQVEPEQIKPALYTYGQSLPDAPRRTLPCGGTLRILLEKLVPDDHGHFQELSAFLNQGRCASRLINLETGKTQLKSGLNPELLYDETLMTHTLGPAYKLLLTGAGEASRCVAELAQAVDFAVTVCEFREEYLTGSENHWLAQDIELVKGFPDELIKQRFSDEHSAIITLAHDPRIDDMALMEAFHGDAFYIAAMGSQRTSESRRERLLELGVTEEQLERLYAPAGVPTGSKTPWEIAISIVAQLTAARNQCE